MEEPRKHSADPLETWTKEDSLRAKNDEEREEYAKRLAAYIQSILDSHDE